MKSIVVLLIIFCQCQGNGCPKGWIRFLATDRCYYINDVYETYDGANNYCKQQNAQLEQPIKFISNMDLNNFLATHRQKCRKGENCDEFWIGIQNITMDNCRTSGNLLYEMKLLGPFWDTGFPKENEGHCGIMSFKGFRQQGTWRNTDCTRKLKFVCITCPDNFDYLPEINQCLYLNLNIANWSEARLTCPKFKRGAQLLTIKDSVKQEAVKRYLIPRFVAGIALQCAMRSWIEGGKMVWMGGQTKYPDVCKTPYFWKPVGAPETPFTYTNWYPGTPNCARESENCAMMATFLVRDYRWEDGLCYDKKCYVCEF